MFLVFSGSNKETEVVNVRKIKQTEMFYVEFISNKKAYSFTNGCTVPRDALCISCGSVRSVAAGCWGRFAGRTREEGGSL